MMKRAKITIVGAGNVGATAAHWAASKELGDVVLVDIAEGIPQGKGLDLFEASPVEGFDSRIIGANNYETTKDSDVVVITAGLPRKPGMSRDDLLSANAKIVGTCAREAYKYSPNAVYMIVSNPLDAMCHVAHNVTGIPKNRIIGMAGVLDTARYKSFIAEALDVSVEDVSAFVLGGHGDTMVPVPRYTSVGGVPLQQLLPADKIQKIVERTRNGGAEIVGLLKTGSAFYAPSASVIQMVEAVVRDKKRVLPCACLLQGEYGIKDLFIGVLAKLGRGGIEKIIEVELNSEEKAGLEISRKAVEGLVASLKNMQY
jgi:malate dehydrogenase